MGFIFRTEPTFDKSFEKLTKKDNALKERALKKIGEICTDPEIGKPLRNKLKGKRRVQIGHYVIIYAIFGNDIVFLNFAHHDFAYK
jgi:mRNA-degrading endonuclease RelE of RelBE toxin-antitoxin system